MMNYSNRSSGISSSLKDDNTSYPKLLEEINNYWNENTKKTEKIKEDIKILERMFLDYGSNTVFIQSKNVLIQKLEHHNKILNNLEEHFYILKRKFNIN